MLDEPRHRQASGVQTLAGQSLVARRRGRRRRVPRQAERLGHARRDQGRTIADREQAVDRSDLPGIEQRRRRGCVIVKADRHGAVAPGILEHRAAIGRQAPDRCRGAPPLPRTSVSGNRWWWRRAERVARWPPARQTSVSCSGFGSAQQYHGSSRCGTARPTRAASGCWPRPAGMLVGQRAGSPSTRRDGRR